MVAVVANASTDSNRGETSPQDLPHVCAHYKYGNKKAKLVRSLFSTTYDFPQGSKAGMLLKNKEGSISEAELVSALSSTTYQL
jgi:hypothetical protein